MIKPTMPHEVFVKTPEYDEEGNQKVDRFGRPSLIEQHTPARVVYELKTVYTKDGVSKNAVVEIDIPADVPIEEGSEIRYEDTSGNSQTRRVLSIGSSTNFSARKVLFRTVHLG